MAMKSLTGFDAASQRIVSVGSPTGASDAATKAYVDNLLAGLRWKAPARAATTGTISLTGVQTVDTVLLTAGDRVLVKNQSTASENGVYTVSETAWSRAQDNDSPAELHGAAILVTSGDVNADKAFVQITDNPAVGTNPVVWNQFGAGNTYTADGQGLELSGSTFGVEVAPSGGLTKGSSGIALNPSVAGAGLSHTGGVLDVEAGDGLSVAADSISVDATVVRAPSTVVRKYTANNPTMTPGTPATITHGLNTRDVTVAIYEGSSGTAPMVFADVAVTGVNTITITSAAGNAADTLRIVIHG